jgi:WD40 repeat protein
VRVWDSDSGACLRVLEGHTRGVTSVTAWSAPEGGMRLATASQDTTVRVWRLPTAAKAAAKAAEAAAKAAEAAAKGADVRAGQSECTICLDTFDTPKNGPGPTDTVTTKCYHRFHRKCINKWLEQHNNCPVCKRVIEGQLGGRKYKKKQTRHKRQKKRHTRRR